MLLASLTLLAGAGCSRVETPRMQDSDNCIEITIGNIHPSLKSKASERGDDAFNENLVQSVDCFFYTNGQTDSPAVFTALGRGAEAKAEGDSTVYVVKVFFNDADALKMFGSTTSGTCQFFVVCNAPLSYGADTSVPALKELVVENDFTAQTVQGSFVMSADEPGTVTLTSDGDSRSASGRVKVSRAAAKIQFFLDIPETFVDETGQFWEPVLSAGVQISLSNSVKRGKVDGDYSVQPSDYVSYGARIVDSLDTGNRISGYETYKFTHVPFYSYPCAWSDLSDYACQVVFRIAWRIVGESDYIWKKYQLSPNISTLDLKRNHYYRTFVRVQSLGGADKEHEVIIPEADYVIIPWIDEGATAGEGQVPGQLTLYKYLVVDEPEVTINNEETAYFTYVTSAPLKNITFTKVVYYNNSNANPETTYNFTGTSGVRTTETGNVTVNGNTISYSMTTPGLITISHSLSNVYSQWKIYATITNEDNCTQNLVIEQNPSIRMLRKPKSGDVFVNGYFARVAGSPFGTSYTQGGSTYYRDPQSSNGTSAVTMPNPSRNYGTTIYKGATSGSLSTFYTTEVNISSFNTDNNTYTYTYGGSQHTQEYRIGDPRKTTEEVYGSSWTLYPYLYYNNTTQGANAEWQEPLKILTTSQNAEEQNIVAPKFLVSSSLNAMLTTGLPTFDQAVSRAAVYQEAGYPAGRWRIPTEAEVAFIVARQQDGTIPDLYVEDSDYWTGSGRLIYIADSGTSITFKDGGSEKQSVRFVYDLWYWGEESSTTNVYHPNGHIYNYAADGSATLRGE